MQFHITGRQGGKTSQLLDWMEGAPEGEHRVMVCHTRERSMQMLNLSRVQERKLESWQFVSAQEVLPYSRAFSGVLYGRGGHIVLGIDDLDLTINHMFGFIVERVTATGELI